MSASDIRFEVLTREELGNAISGDCLNDGTVIPARLVSPKLKYYHYPSPLKRGKFLFVMATVALTPEEQKEHADWYRHPEKMRKPVGVLELEWSPFEENVVWLTYVTVDPLWQRQGIARQLVRNMADVLTKENCRLERSRPSDEGLKHIKSFIDETLNDAGIIWTQGEPLCA